MATCLVCGSDNLKAFYNGPIRMGSFGKVSDKQADITECANCGARHLPPVMEDIEAYYRTGEYRADLDQGNAVEKYFQLTDNEQTEKLDILGLHHFRGKVVADIGAGAGPFLDLVKGVAARTIAVEPNENYHASLRERGHEVFPSTVACASAWGGRLDAAVSFSVVEHVEKPREFLAEIKTLLKPGARLVVSTPNANDYLLELCPAYQAFFYRKVHLWYFHADSFRKLAELAGFSSCAIHYRHRFDLSNSLIWLRDRRPSGLGAIKLDPAVDAVWKQHLETSGRSDYFYAVLA
ncbi:MAG: class I SAM-dependent methyltransferase [Verrucomicrobiota bacterium]